MTKFDKHFHEFMILVLGVLVAVSVNEVIGLERKVTQLEQALEAPYDH